MKTKPSTIILAVLILLFSPKIVGAYLDPGTGSFLIQLIIAAVAGISFSVKLYWNKIKVVVRGFSSKFFKGRKNDVK